MTESRRRKVLLFSLFLSLFLSAALLAAPAYSQESIFSGYYNGPFLQCKQTKKVDHGGCWVLKNAAEAKSRCQVFGNAGGSHWSCKKSGEAAVAKSKSK